MQDRSSQHLLESIVNDNVSKGYIELTPEERLSPQIVANKLITTMLYESRRHGWHATSCIHLRDDIGKLVPVLNGKDMEKFELYIKTEEQIAGTYFGSYLSDNSDSECEARHRRLSNSKKKNKRKMAHALRSRSQIKGIVFAKNTKDHKSGDLRLDGSAASKIFDFKERQKIYYSRFVDKEKIARDLELLNDKIKAGIPLDNALKWIREESKKQGKTFTDFYIAEYRGVTHSTSLWNKGSRVAHRQDKDEIGKRQYSASVYSAAGLNLFRDYKGVAEKVKSEPKVLDEPANLLREILLTLREPKPYSYGNYTYSNLAYLLQNVYSQDYHGFLHLIRHEPRLRAILLNGEIPFVSMGDIPYHALKYALGMKPYPGYENIRLQPRWRSDGRAERPYTGVVYVSLHPITDFNNDGPLHMVSLNRAAEVKLQKELIIIAERESPFLSFLPEHRVIHKYLAKFPSFNKPYCDSMLFKYGLTEDEYNKFKIALQGAAPHSQERKNIKMLLAETLCSYQESRLIEIAKITASQRGGVLIYRGIDGQFSLTPPSDSVFRNCKEMKEDDTGMRGKVKQMQEKRASYSFKRLSLDEVTDERAHFSILGDIDKYLDIDETNIGVNGNLSMSMPVSLMLNSITNKRYLALKRFLREPLFFDAMNQRINTQYLKGGSLLHLAALRNDVEAVKLLIEVPSCDLHVGVEELTEDDHNHYPCCGYKFYEHMTPAQLAIKEGNNDVALAIIKHPRHDSTVTCAYVINKNLYNTDQILEQDEDHGLPGYLGVAYHHREGATIERIAGNSLLHVAVHADNKAIIPSLLSVSPMSIFHKNSDHNTAADDAVLNGKNEIFDLLHHESVNRVDQFFREIKVKHANGGYSYRY